MWKTHEKIFEDVLAFRQRTEIKACSRIFFLSCVLSKEGERKIKFLRLNKVDICSPPPASIHTGISEKDFESFLWVDYDDSGVYNELKHDCPLNDFMSDFATFKVRINVSLNYFQLSASFSFGHMVLSFFNSFRMKPTDILKKANLPFKST